MITLPIYCSKEKRCTDHSLKNEDLEAGGRQMKITCLSCQQPEERIDIIVEDQTSVKKTIWDEFKRAGMPDLRDPEIITMDDSDEEREQHHERHKQQYAQIKKQLMENSKTILKQWKPILIVSVVFLLVLKLVFQVI